RQDDASANLVVLGDKSLLFAEHGEGFIMYGVSGRSWVALGDPVGPVDEWHALTASFIDESVQHGGWALFYKGRRDHLCMYLDFGLSVVKLGEEARVCLTNFSLDGPERRNLRRVHRKAEEEGCAFEVLEEPAAIAPLLPRLRAVSDAWLDAKHTREKRFSLGHFR